MMRLGTMEVSLGLDFIAKLGIGWLGLKTERGL